MLIAIDARILTNPPTGVGNYLIAVVNHIAEYRPCWQIYLLVNRSLDKEVCEKLSKSDRIIIYNKPFFVLGGIGFVWHFFKLYFILKNLKPDCFWAPASVSPPVLPNRTPSIVTVHDFVSQNHEKTMKFSERVNQQLYFNRSVRKADMLWTLSEYTKNLIEVNFTRRKSRKIIVGTDIDRKIFKKQNHQSRDRLAVNIDTIEKPILFVGTIEPRKNLKFLISLLPDLAPKGFSLIVAGDSGWGSTGIDKIMHSPGFPGNKICFTGFIKTRELVALYNLASLLVVPSINEGFGLPALEAMSCGCPVVAADNSGLREVVSGGGMLVQGWDKKKWVDSIVYVHENRDSFIKNGFKKAKTYNLERVIASLDELT